MVARVEHSWARIAQWLSVNVPWAIPAIAPPASPQAIADAEREIGVRLPEDLKQWWLLADGMTDMVLCLPPECQPLPIADSLSDRRTYLESWRGMGEPTSSGEPAGEMSLPFLDLYLPIGTDGCGGYLFVDLREGDLRGSVGWCGGEETHDGAEWASTAHLLETAAEAMDAGVPCQGPYGGTLPEPDPESFVVWRSAEESRGRAQIAANPCTRRTSGLPQ
jgi:cell wall assembly regulator SMI1